MRTIIEADSGRCINDHTARISHKNLEPQTNKVIDADKRYSEIMRCRASAHRHQRPLIIAREDTGVILA